MAESSLHVPDAARPAVAIRSGPIERLLASFASLFEGSRPRSRARGVEIALFALVIGLGALLRFWNLGSVGLHGDEKTMALPLMHLVHHGTPLFPSGMYYARDIAQLDLMAGSVELFGPSAWALRFPSALCGVLLIALTPLAGRRFLTIPWNLALTATVAFLPSFIDDAQTARMYVFLVACVAAYVVLLVQWELTGRNIWLAAATLALVIGIEFHQLAVFAAFLVFYPGLLRADNRKLAPAIAAFATITLSFFLISHWIDSYFPDTETVSTGPQAAAVIRPEGAVLALGAAGFALLETLVGRALSRAAGVTAGVATGALFGLALFAQLSDAYHVAAIFDLAAIIILARAAPVAARRTAWLRTCAVALAASLLLAVQLVLLGRHGVPPRQAAGALLGWPSVWPYLAISRYSPFSVLALAAGIAWGCVRLAQRRPVPDYLLFVALGVWIPILMIGTFKWDIPSRYAAAEIFPLLIGAFAAAQGLWSTMARGRSAPRWQLLVAALVALLAVNPASLARTVGSGYGDHPDHVGAARFVRAHLRPGDLVIAEDVIVQTYYLGRVDYWLIGQRTALQYGYRRNGRFEDFYTNTPIISNARQLEALIARRDRGAIYIIGSGEQQEDGRAAARGPSLERFLTSPGLQVVFVGRDHLTKVWKIPPPFAAPAAGSAAPSAATRPGGRSGMRG